MTPIPDKIKILIAYNAVPNAPNGADLDAISEAAVLDEVNAMAHALHNLGYRIEKLPCTTLPQILQTVQHFQPDVIINLCEGFQHRSELEAHLTSLWELLAIPYTGNTPQTLGLAQNKVLTKKLLQAAGLPTPNYRVFETVPAACDLEFPLIAKPSREDGSVGITQQSVSHDLAQLQEVVGNLLAKYRQPILVEKYIAGREFNISLLGNEPPRVLPPSELSFAAVAEQYHAIASYEAKWLNEHPLYQMTPPICPAQIDESLRARLSQLAEQVYCLLMGRDYGRVDIRMDNDSNLYVLEYNPNPDISPDAGYVRALRAAGLTYEDFADFLIKAALKRKHANDHS